MLEVHVKIGKSIIYIVIDTIYFLVIMSFRLSHLMIDEYFQFIVQLNGEKFFFFLIHKYNRNRNYSVRLLKNYIEQNSPSMYSQSVLVP